MRNGQQVVAVGLCLVGLAVVAERASSGPQAEATDGRAIGTVTVRSSPPDSREGSDGSLLVRELYRQAMLIAARDGHGLATRDATLGESAPSEGRDGDVVLGFEISTVPQDAVRYQFRPADSSPTHKGRVALGDMDTAQYVQLIEDAEEKSRGEFVEYLSEMVGERERRASNRGDEEFAFEKLREFNVFSQYLAVRELHAANRSAGESDEVLGGLVRGYAHLGLLSEPHWNAANRAYKARALLYAARMRRVGDGSAGRWHMAYALALTGFHRAALEEMESAAADDGDAPIWAEAMEAYCRYDADRLTELAGDGELRRLATLLKAVSMWTGGETIARRRQSAVDALVANPRCNRLLVDISQLGTGSEHDWASAYASNQLTVRVRELLSEVRGLPKEAENVWASAVGPTSEIAAVSAANVERDADSAWRLLTLQRRADLASEARADIVDALTTVADGDAGEPSWGVLGRLVDDVTFAHVASRARNMFQRGWTEFSSNVRPALPLIVYHPYLEFVEALVTSHKVSHEASILAMAEITLSDVTFAFSPMRAMTNRVPSTNGRDQSLRQEMFRYSVWHCDATANDLGRQVTEFEPPNRAYVARALLEASPHSPLAMATLVSDEWSSVSGDLEEWLGEHPEHVPLLRAVCDQHLQAGEPEKAIELLERVARLEPSESHGVALLRGYAAADRDEAMLAALDELMECLDEGDAAALHRAVAVQLYKKKRFDEALSHAERAYSANVVGSVLMLANCYEAVGQWREAERLMKRIAEEYPGYELAWRLWCARTGEGDVEHAHDALEMHWMVAESRQMGVGGERAIMALVEKDYGRARGELELAFRQERGTYYGLHLLLTAERQADERYRDAIVEQVISRAKTRPHAGEVVELATEFRRMLAEDAEVDRDKMDEMLAGMSDANVVDLGYFLGEFLRLRGETEAARKYLEQVAGLAESQRWNYALAVLALQELRAEADAGE